MLLDGRSPEAIVQCARRLADGELVALPTETVYGLGAAADQASAVARIFAAKGRPSDHPLIVHVAADPQLQAQAVAHFVSEVPPFAQRLMQAFWPGPLTLILPRRPEVAAACAGGQDSIGMRCPDHPVAQALLQACALQQPPLWGVAAPSANRFGRVSPTTARHVIEELGDAAVVLDGGACPIGIESTIVDASRGVPVLLRPGQLARADIEAVAGERLRDPADLPGSGPRASGTLASHYAPSARVRLMDAATLQTALDVLGPDVGHVALYARSPLRLSPVQQRAMRQRAMPADAAATAHELFATLRELDTSGVRLIWVETPPDDPAWEGVADRLRRAAAH